MSLRKVVLVVKSLKGHSASVSGNSAHIYSAQASLVKSEIKACLVRASVTPQLEVSQSVFLPSHGTQRLHFIISASCKKLCGVALCSSDQNQMEPDDFGLLKSKADLTSRLQQHSFAV